MKIYLNLLAIATLTFTGCSSTFIHEGRGWCAYADKRAWVLTQTPRGREMITLRELIENPNKVLTLQCSEYSVESWYALPSGELMICQSAGPMRPGTEVAWYQFSRNDKEWSITDYGGGCIIVTS
jgi:hypothetical protein